LKLSPEGTPFLMSEPGVDLHDWESMWASVAQDAGDNPDAAVSQLADIVQRMLLARGYHLGDAVAVGGDEPEIVVTYLAAREATERAEIGEAPRAEVESAIDDLQAIFDTLVAEPWT
jgi:hypothetical protein